MAALFSHMQAADMPDDEYAKDQISRHMPAVGRGADMRRHQSAKYRRSVLRELVGWWIGMQGDARPLDEKHRRFFYRFEVEHLLARAGFAVERIYGDYDRIEFASKDQPELIFLATKQ